MRTVTIPTSDGETMVRILYYIILYYITLYCCLCSPLATMRTVTIPASHSETTVYHVLYYIII